MSYLSENHAVADTDIMKDKPVLDIKKLVLYIQKELETNGIDPEAPKKISIEYLQKMSIENLKKDYPYKKRP